MSVTDSGKQEESRDVRGDELFDPHRLGPILEGAMTRARYTRAADLMLDVYNITGMRWHENTLYNVFNGKNLPNLNMLFALMMTLGMSIDELLPAVQERHRERFGRLMR